MAAHALTRVLLDLLSNELAYRSGLLLTQREIREVGQHVEVVEYRRILLGDLDDVVSRVSDFYGDLARSLRVVIGNHP